MGGRGPRPQPLSLPSVHLIISPLFFSGRVNLIGEHIDYEGYAVLPMAIAPDTAIAIRRVPDGGGAAAAAAGLRLANVDPARYPAATFSVDPAQAVDTAHHAWGNYFVCAYKGAFEWAASAGLSLEPAGLEVMVHGTVPLGELRGRRKKGGEEPEARARVFEEGGA